LRQSRIVGDGLTCLTFGACTTKEHIYTRWARIVEESRMVGDGLTCLTFGHVPPKEHIYTKGGPG
jgi:hypothetical protein